jgi:Bacterial regulatory proteins, gntR family
MPNLATRNEDKQSLSPRSNPAKHLSPPASHSSRASRALVSLAAVLLVVASAGFGCTFAWRLGAQQGDELLGLLSIAMALGLELSKPFAVASAFTQLRSFRIVTATALTVVGLLAIAFSLQSELTFMSMTRGDLVAGRASVRNAQQRAETRYQKVQASLDALNPVSNKDRDLNAYLEQRAALQADLRAAEKDRETVPAITSADPGAVALAAYAASLGLKIDPAVLGLWLPLVGVLALEAGAAFSVVLVRSVNSEKVAHVAQPLNTGDAAALQTACAVEDRKEAGPLAKRAAKPKRRKDDDDDQAGPRKRGLSGLIDAVQANGGSVVSLSQRKLARQLGVGRTTLQRALNDLVDAGAAVLDTSRIGTTVTLAS